MRKWSIAIVLSLIGLTLCYCTFVSARDAFRSDLALPESSGKAADYRLVLITQELETTFWDQVGQGALEQAEREGVSLKVWGSYGSNHEDFLRQIELAIQSKVDGIIVQGLDTEEFKQLTKVKAAFYGIPIITVANDVPMAESLRRTYIGSDQFVAGKRIAEQLVADMGDIGEVVLMGDSNQEYYQEQRLSGIRYVLASYPQIETVYAETPATRERVFATTQDILNRWPGTDAFIAVNANITGAMLQEIGRRTQVYPLFIYTFDDGPDSWLLLEQGKLDGLIVQAPEKMGRMAVEKIVGWLNGEIVPLDMKGYFTEIELLKAADQR